MSQYSLGWPPWGRHVGQDGVGPGRPDTTGPRPPRGGVDVARGMSRREFVERSAGLALLAGLAGGSVLAGLRQQRQWRVLGYRPAGPPRQPGHPARQRDRSGGERQGPRGRHAAGAQLCRLPQPRDVRPRSSRSSAAKVEITIYDTEDKLLANLRNESLTFDLVFGATTLSLPKFVVGKLIQPLNQDYLPELLQRAVQPAEPVLRRRLEVQRRPTSSIRPGSAYRRDLIDDGALRRRGRAGSCCGIPPTRVTSG